MVVNKDNQELNDMMGDKPARVVRRYKESNCEPIGICADEKPADYGKLTQWTTGDGKKFIPAGTTKELLPPGVYEIHHSSQIGLFFQRIPVRTEGLLRFPQTNSEKVLKEIEVFWDREKYFTEYDITYKRGIILWGPPGCHAKGTLIRMFDGSLKKVEDVKVGDILIGPDSKSRKVLELKTGSQMMYRIIPTKGKPFIVNEDHILHLEWSGKRENKNNINISVRDYLKLSIWQKNRYKLRYSDCIDFKRSGKNLLIDPYMLGVWLGDGSKKNSAITNKDKVIVDSIHKYAVSNDLAVTVNDSGGRCPTYHLVSPERKKIKNGWYAPKGSNALKNNIRSLKLLNNKHIPLCYLQASRQDRLALLAGLIDTDGYYSHLGCFEITQKNLKLSNDIVSIARSLGFLVTMKTCRKTIKSINFAGTYFRINICGNISEVPCKVAYKRSGMVAPNKNNLRTGFSVEKVGVDRYYGFTLNKDNLYLTSDYIIHHNSGKTCTVNLIMKDVVDRKGIVIKFTNPGLFIEGVRVLREVQPDTPVVVLMEDIDSIIEHYEESPVLNILDGVESIYKMVFLATTNYPELLGPRIINRPSRFDKRFKIPYPNDESREMYLKYLCKDKPPQELKIDLKKWVKDTENFSIAHIKELFVAVVILGDNYAEALENLQHMKETVSSSHDVERRVGFGPAKTAYSD